MEDTFSVVALSVLCAMSSCRMCLGNRNGEFVIEDILPTTKYNKYEAPKIDGQPAVVTVRMAVVNIRSVDESTMSYQSDIVLHRSWEDHRLRFPYQHSNASKVNLDVNWRNGIWTPDTFFKNRLEGKVQSVIIPYMYIWLFQNKTVFFSSRLSLQLSCEMDLERFPHDTQECDIKIMSLTTTTEDMVLNWNENSGLQLTSSLLLPQFDIRNVSTKNCTKKYEIGSFSCLSGVLQLQRRIGYYVINVYIPSILIVVMSMLTFWIPPEAVPARVTLGVTSLLTIVTKQYQSSIPSVSYIVAMNVWMSSCIAFVFCGLLEYAVVIWMVKKKAKKNSMSLQSPTPSSDKPITEFLQIEPPMPQVKQKWKDVLCGLWEKVNLDHMSRIFFPLAFLIYCILYWTKYSS